MIYLNGKIIEPSEARISVFDRSYLFGEGIFETLRSYKGKLPFLDKHLSRMEWGATFIGIPFPHPSEIKEGIQSLLKANKLSDARIKIVLSAQGASLMPTLLQEDAAINLLIVAEKFTPLSEEEYQDGVELSIVHEIRNDPNPAAAVKSTSRLTKLIAQREFQEKDAFDGILLSATGEVTETSKANLFWIKDKIFCTPAVSLGLLPGVTREVVLSLAKENGYAVKEVFSKPSVLMDADEVFITGSTLEVMPVIRIDQNDIRNGKPGKLVGELRSWYSVRLQEEMES